MKKAVIALALVLGLTACTDSKGAIRLLQNQGYTDIHITGYSFLGCSEDDTFKTGFIAKNQNGIIVRGVICSGWFKGSTLRLY